MVTHCQSCGAPIIWALTAKGRRIPLNAEPDPQGNITTTEDEWGRTLAHFVKLTPLFPNPPGERYTSHFGTCQWADKWRQKR